MPSLLGATPRSESRIAFSIAASVLRSCGRTSSWRASGTWIVASWTIGTWVP